MMPPLTFDPRRSGIHSRARGNGPAADGTAAERAALEKTWHVPEGILGWFSVVDHRTIGRRYLVTALGFFLVAGILAVLMRLQLAVPDNQLIGPDRYNQIFTVHGTIMMFLFGTPMVAAFANYLVPLQVGTADMVFPRLNALSYWLFLFGGIVVLSEIGRASCRERV